ncbi:MAG: pilus assembly protein [Burkholderiaceae bacterium]|uniref:TfpX/TfpZ family type IV pilin accessory protein n=1 Tax=Hylemonella sp. TaxID=2066020 RepID=UPI0035ADF11F|nr:pilus assembly protein [Burkholderiaceae bacterium]
MSQASTFHWKGRLLASGVHLGGSLLIAAIAALLVFGLWYPYPYRDSSGGGELFLIVITVDVILGPLITLTVFNRSKPRAVLVRDLATVGALQLAALMYGLWVVSAARPVHLVYEFDRFSVVHAVEVPAELLDRVSKEVQPMPWSGPTVLAVRSFKNDAERVEATIMALQGLPLAARADLWEPYSKARERVLAAAKPLAELRQRFPLQATLIDKGVAQTQRQEATLLYLPMVERKSFWTVLLDAQTAEVRGFIPLDSF